MITLKSPAKINLFLNIINKRKDNYHDIETYFQLINLYDEISLKLIPGNKIKFTSNSNKLSNTDNLCIDAAVLLRNYIRKEKSLNVSIDLQKNIPIGGGLGGGSSNAASILLGLNNLWKCNLSINELSDLGKTLGSDVPVFINGYSAFGKDTGTSLIKHDLEKKYFLIVYPGIEVSSKVMYQNFKINDYINHINLDNMHEYIGFNSFEDLLCSRYHEISDLLGILRKYNNGSVSGSGSCLFSIFDDEESAIKISGCLPKKYQTYVVHSLNTI